MLVESYEIWIFRGGGQHRERERERERDIYIYIYICRFIYLSHVCSLCVHIKPRNVRPRPGPRPRVAPPPARVAAPRHGFVGSWLRPEPLADLSSPASAPLCPGLGGRARVSLDIPRQGCKGLGHGFNFLRPPSACRTSQDAGARPHELGARITGTTQPVLSCRMAAVPVIR